MSTNYVLIKALSAKYGIEHTNFRRLLLRNGFIFASVRVAERRNQLCSCVTVAQGKEIQKLLRKAGYRVAVPVEG